jgi:DNA replication protein DnaC
MQNQDEKQPTEFGDLGRDILRRFHERQGNTFAGQVMGECHAHGFSNRDTYRTPEGKILGNDCPQCADLAAIQQTQAEHAQELRDARAATIARRFEAAAIPPRFTGKTLENFEADTPEQKRILLACKGYADNFKQARELGTCLIFSGGAGTGKTHLSAGIANAVMGAGYSALFSTVAGAVRRVRSTWKNNDSEQDAINLFCAPDLLILDEVGIQSGSDNEHQIIFEILNARYERALPTILLSNLPISGEGEAKTVRRYLGDRITDRLREGGGKAFVFDWASARGGK